MDYKELYEYRTIILELLKDGTIIRTKTRNEALDILERIDKAILKKIEIEQFLNNLQLLEDTDESTD